MKEKGTYVLYIYAYYLHLTWVISPEHKKVVGYMHVD